MRDRRNRLGATAVVGGLALLATGCAHNDVLVFGTSTTIGLNVQTAGTGAGPSIVLGYEREEAVWMPLIANGRDSRVSNCPADSEEVCLPSTQVYPLEQALYQSTIIDPSGTRALRTDAYSVFASLGAKFNGDVDGDGAQAGGGLAQFFATGNAALNVSNNAALITALKVGEGDSQAMAVAAASFSNDPSALRAFGQSLPDAGAPEENNQVSRAAAATARGQVAMVQACARADGGWRWRGIADGVEGPMAATAASLRNHTSGQWPSIENALLANASLRTAVLASGVKTFQCAGE